jgi:hypothetical protein
MRHPEPVRRPEGADRELRRRVRDAEKRRGVIQRGDRIRRIRLLPLGPQAPAAAQSLRAPEIRAADRDRHTFGVVPHHLDTRAFGTGLRRPLRRRARARAVGAPLTQRGRPQQVLPLLGPERVCRPRGEGHGKRCRHRARPDRARRLADLA